MTDNEKKEKSSVNETDPRLRFDAFTAGVKNGGLRSLASINLLICYIAGTLGKKVTAQNILDTVDAGMIANHFETAQAIANLKSSGVIKENDDKTLELADGQDDSVELIERDLPLTIRDKSIKICQKIIARRAYERENKSSIEKLENGYSVTLNISDRDTEFLELKLYAATEEQAQTIKEKFINDPVRVYDTLIDAIFDN